MLPLREIVCECERGGDALQMLGRSRLRRLAYTLLALPLGRSRLDLPTYLSIPLASNKYTPFISRE